MSLIKLANVGLTPKQERQDVDLTPFRLVADAFMCGRRVIVEPFIA